MFLIATVGVAAVAVGFFIRRFTWRVGLALFLYVCAMVGVSYIRDSLEPPASQKEAARRRHPGGVAPLLAKFPGLTWVGGPDGGQIG